jgi:hypothetical protein
LHIPKTGGTSAIHALKKKYPFNFFKIEAGSSLRAAERKFGDHYDSFDQCYDLRESVALYAMEAGYKCIAGHVPYSSQVFENPTNNYLLMTILRNPVQRFISKYLYNYHKSSEHCKLEMEFPDYLESEVGKQSGREYLRYLSGYSVEKNEKTDDDLVKISKENLKKIDLVGILEELEDFKSRFYQKTGMEIRIPHKNKTKHFTEEQTFDKATTKRVQEICKCDIELYNFAIHQIGE